MYEPPPVAVPSLQWSGHGLRLADAEIGVDLAAQPTDVFDDWRGLTAKLDLTR